MADRALDRLVHRVGVPPNPSPHPAKDPGLPPRAGVRFLWNEIDRDTAGQLDKQGRQRDWPRRNVGPSQPEKARERVSSLEQENSVLAARLSKLETPRELAEK
jgi:hypothetical protein